MLHTQLKEKGNSERKTFKREKILIVDDDEAIRDLLRRILAKEGYTCERACDAEEAIDFLKTQSVDLVISDVAMPGKSGIQLLKEIKKNHPNVPTLMISGISTRKTAESVISMGAYDFLLKPFQKKQVLISVSNALRRRALDLQSQFEVQNLENIIQDQTQDLFKANERLNNILDGIIKAMSLAVESRDPYTAGHQQRVADIAVAIAIRMNFSLERIQYLKMAGLIHDIGKISVPAEILCKPTRLSDSEFNIMKEHPLTGFKILKEIEFPYPLAKIVYQHHERLDGSGYPNGLSGDETYMEAKILAVADVVEAMASHRPYRPSLGVDIALDEIRKNRGRMFDPDVVDTCCYLFENNLIKLS
ncbi:MAG: response regulator [Desulfobacteraceae bacterium]|nr:response regulator [Desulfobacteraceae bacterium]MBC2755027.1 response regulator [Desulfobacteraceae bacterium]